MAAEARALLDEQIAILNELRVAAQDVYLMTAAFPAVSRQSDPEAMARGVARRAVAASIRLERCLRRAEHWLGETAPVYVPMAEGNYPSAGAGAGTLAFVSLILCQVESGALLILCQVQSGADDPEWTANVEVLADALAAKWGDDGIPDWMFSAPVDVLQELAEVARRETDTAIQRLTDRFQKAAFTQHEIAQGIQAAHAERTPAESDDALPKSKRADSPSRIKAKSAYCYAMERIPNAHAMTAPELFDAIKENEETAAMLPPTAESFTKYLNDCGIRLKKGGPRAAGGSVVRQSDL